MPLYKQPILSRWVSIKNISTYSMKDRVTFDRQDDVTYVWCFIDMVLDSFFCKYWELWSYQAILDFFLTGNWRLRSSKPYFTIFMYRFYTFLNMILSSPVPQSMLMKLFISLSLVSSCLLLIVGMSILLVFSWDKCFDFKHVWNLPVW